MNDDLPQRTDRVGLLRTDESLMTMATEMANVAVWEYDFVRDSMERSANHDALYGLEWQDHWHSSTFLNATHESDRERCFSAIESCLVPGGPFQYAFDFRVIWPDRSIHWLWVKGEIIRRDSSGRGNLIRGIVLDVTDRRIKEARVEYLSRLYSALSEVNQAIVRMESEELLFPLVCRMAVDHGGMVLASVGQESAEGGLIKSVFCYGRGQDYLSQVSIATSESFPEGRGPVGTAFRENRVVVVDHFLQSEMTRPWHALARSFGWGSVAAFPIRRADRPFAVLSVYHTDEKAFDPQAIDLLDEMARDVSFALDSFDRERERVQIKGQLVASERHFRAYFERAMVGMAAATPDYRFCEVNDALCTLLGYSKKELIGMSWIEFTHPEDVSESLRMREFVMRGDLEEFEQIKRCIRKDGALIHAQIAVRAVRGDQGVVEYFVVIVNDITELKNQQQKLERLIHHDPLTGLPNRVLLNDRLDMAVAQANRSGGNVAVCFLDLDGFKRINDTYGHAMGDKVLIEIARRLVSASRLTDTVARFGGDEFIMILPRVSGEQECREMLGRVMQSIEAPLIVSGLETRLTSSIGVAIYPDHLTDGSTLLRHADQAMYIAKQKGRQRIHFFDAVTDHLAQVRSEGLLRIEQALEDRELTLYYQPIVNMCSWTIVSMEALLRWQHPERGLLAPGEFLVLIENSEFEIRLSEWVIAQAFSQADAWRKQGINLSVSINLIARHLQFHGFVDFITDMVSRYPLLEKGSIKLEILETAAIGDMDSAIHKMNQCLDMGLRFSIDDFGTGYASLSYLRRLPVDSIKIDLSFVQGMLEDADDLSITQGVISLANAFQKEVIAEGVETCHHGRKLLEMGCQLGQGYVIARPMSADQVALWYREFKIPDGWSDL